MLWRARATRFGSRSSSTTLALGHRAATQSPTTPTPAADVQNRPDAYGFRSNGRSKKYRVRSGTVAIARLAHDQSAAKEKVLARRICGTDWSGSCAFISDHPLAKPGIS